MNLPVKISELIESKFDVAELAIIKAENNAIRSLDRKAVVAEIDSMVDYICKDVGINTSNNEDDGYYRIRFIDLVLKYYSDLSKSEIKLAFEMAIIGELDDFLPKYNGQPDRNHYSRFSPEYAMKILNAYKRKKAQIKRKAEQYLPKEKEITPDQIKKQYMEFIDYLDSRMNEYKDSGKKQIFVKPLYVLHFFKYLGITKTIPDAKPDETKAFESIINGEYPSEFRDKIIRMKETKEVNSLLKTISESSIYNQKITEVFDYMIKHERKIKDYVRDTSANEPPGVSHDK